MKTPSVLSISALALLGAFTLEASAVTFNMTPLYDEQNIELNALDNFAPGGAPYAPFRANVQAAFGLQSGGVVNFDEIQSFTFTAFGAVVGAATYHLATFNSAAFGIGGGTNTWFTGNGGGWVPISGLPNNPPFTGTEYLSTTGANSLYYNFDFDALNAGTRVQAAGITVLGNPGPVAIDFYAFDGNGNPLGHISDSVGNAVNDDTFFGIDAGISTIRYVSVVGSGGTFKVDDLAFHGAVPEPATGALLLAGLAFPWRLRRKVGALAAVALAAVVATPESRAVSAYGIDGIGDLRLITNLNTMTSTVLGPTGFGVSPVNVGLAIDPLGQLYAANGSGNIYSLAPNGTPTLLGNPGLGPITGLDWDTATNDLLVLSATPAHLIFHANPVTGAFQGPPPVNAGIIGQAEDIAWLAGSVGYITVLNGPLTEVHLINLTTGLFLPGTPATSGAVDNWTGVDVDPATNTAYMIGWVDDSWQIANGGGNLTATQLGTGTHLDWTAFAIIPTPEPSSAALLLGSAVFAGLRRQRRTA